MTNRFLSKKYGLTLSETNDLINHPKFKEIEKAIESFIEKNGFPSANSPLVRGLLLDKMRTT